MKKLIIKITFLISIYLVLSIIFFTVVSAQYNTAYDAAVLDKIDRLESTESPKIILVGDSNLVFGIDSSKLQSAMNMPVVNLGLHASFGNKFNELIAKDNINKGDIVILSQIDYNDDDKLYAPKLFWYTLENHFKLWKIIGPIGLAENAITLPEYCVNALKKYINGTGNQAVTGTYARANFNEYGDIKRECHIGSNIKVSKELFSSMKISSKCINRINAFTKYCEDRGATLLISSVPILNCEYTPDDSIYDSFEKELRNKTKCEVISKWQDYLYEPEYFFDGYPHLNAEGADLRTIQLIKDLKSWENSKNE